MSPMIHPSESSSEIIASNDQSMQIDSDQCRLTAEHMFRRAITTGSAAAASAARAGSIAYMLHRLEQRDQLKEFAQHAFITAAALRPDPRWHESLRLLDGLTELFVILKGGCKHLSLPVGSLSAGLRVLDCGRLDIIETAASSSAMGSSSGVRHLSATAAAGLMSECASSATRTCTQRLSSCDQIKEVLPNLKMLSLTDCQVTSPGILASRQLQQLKVLRSNWQGGWAAAAAAWPSVKELVWEYDSTFSSSTGSSSRNSDASSNPAESSASAAAVAMSDTDGESSRKLVKTANPVSEDAVALLKSQIDSSLQIASGPSVREVLPDILAQFRRLKSLTVHDLPWLSVDILKLVEPQHLKQLQHVDFDIRGRIERQEQHGRRYERRSKDSSNTRGSDPKVVKQWLQQQLPWATVA